MNIHNYVIAAALLGPVLVAPAANASDWYGRVSIGESDAEISGVGLSSGTSYGAAVGTSIGPVRVEGGVSHISGDLAGIVEAEALVVSGTAYLDLQLGERASLFGGAGLDYVDGSAEVFGSSIEASGDGYHYVLGGAYRLTDNIIGEVSYRHTEADLDSDFGSVDLEADVVSVGLRLAL